jgi:nicotinate-nucleotide pyrophosphorylase
VLVFINGTNVKNVTENYYKATGLAQNTYYTISLQTMDTNGNINTHNVENTNRTGIRVCSWGHCNTYLA